MAQKNRNRKIIISVFIAIIMLAAALTAGSFAFRKEKNLPIQDGSAPAPMENNASATFAESLPSLQDSVAKLPPPPVSMDRLKTQGCVADGLLTGYNPENDKFIDLINRSNCYYLHRAIETWLNPPDFTKIEANMNQMSKPDIAYGMFIAEAINIKAEYKDEDTGKNFDFKKMCQRDGMYDWGEHTCKPTFSSGEYRDYLKYITRKAIDLGVQSFTFGQIYMQESEKRNYAPRIVKDIRQYAKKKGVDVVIGAQTGSITDEKYLKLFDYIEGGVGIDAKGNIENGPCLSSKGSCWGLLWNKAFSSKAKNVLLHLDWTGVIYDDLDVFARMDPALRDQTLQKLHNYFTAKNMGFLMPYFGVLDKNNGGCYGPKKKFYSPDNAYSCKDEDAINRILAGSDKRTQ
ncbi:MAG: hypothetical protein WC858_05880 [Parcubacteria group bacterium]|jgi:hypothetical protein